MTVVPHSIEDLDVCAVCLGNFTPETVTLDCSHRFHSTCLGVWFQKNRTCPTCRAPPKMEIVLMGKPLVDTFPGVFTLSALSSEQINSILDHIQLRDTGTRAIVMLNNMNFNIQFNTTWKRSVFGFGNKVYVSISNSDLEKLTLIVSKLSEIAHLKLKVSRSMCVDYFPLISSAGSGTIAVYMNVSAGEFKMDYVSGKLYEVYRFADFVTGSSHRRRVYAQ